MLYLISMGLAQENDISLKGLEAAKKCSILYMELYTTKMQASRKKYERIIGKEIIPAFRKEMEDHVDDILKKAKKKHVGILVGGDALSATTHIMILHEAKKRKIPYRVIHGSSIFTAVSETGLQLYKFGKAVTVAYPSDNYFPTQFYDDILLNKKHGFHTLILLDTQNGEKFMDSKDGIEVLLEVEKKKKKGLFDKKEKLIACARLGAKNQLIKYTIISKLLKDKELVGKTPAVLVLPGNLHFAEEEFLESL